MKDKKNIDRLFQEQFKDFEPSAPDGLWNNIEGKLGAEKKSPAILPLWYKVAGIAAGIAILVSILLWTTNDFSRN